MKRSIQAMLAVALVASAFAFRAGAEEGGKDSNGEHKGRWAEKWGLSEDESAKLKDSFKAQREASKPMRLELRDALVKLHDQVEDKASDKDIQASLDRLEQAHRALRAEREKFRAKLATMLTPTQRAKMALRMARMHMRGRGGWGRGKERAE